MGTDGYFYCYVWRDVILELFDKLKWRFLKMEKKCKEFECELNKLKDKKE